MPPTAQRQDHVSQVAGPDGLVRVYDIPAKRWCRKASVDAKEMVEIGTGSYAGPPIEMVGPAGRIKVDRSEVKSKLSEGYKAVNPADLDVADLAETRTEMDLDDEDNKSEDATQSKQPDQPYDFSQHNMVELRKFAEKAGIEHDGVSKVKLCQALDAAGFRPE